MSEVFYNKVLELFLRFSFLLLLLVADIQVLFWYVAVQNLVLYAFWLGLLMTCVLYGISFYGNFDEFTSNLALFIPNNDVRPEPLNIETDDKALRICLYYEQGSTLEQIKNELSLNHATTVQRELRKGLRFLLTFYNEHRHEGVKTT